MATVSIPNFEKGSPTLFNIMVTVQGQSQQVQRRYNEFLVLAREVEEETGTPVPIAPPAKAWFVSAADLEDRRRGLETMIRALARSDECFATLAFQDFLELSRLKRARQDSAPTGDWVGTVNHINELLAEAKKSDTIHRHKVCLNAQGLVASLHRQIDQDNLGARERIRRQHILEELNQRISSLRSDAQGATLAGGSGRAASPTIAGAAPAVKRPGRVLGETHLTRTMDSQQLLMHQKRTVEDQDAEVQQLRDAISRQKELGMAINEEILKQNTMLDDLDADVHRVNTKLNQAQRNTSKFL